MDEFSLPKTRSISCSDCPAYQRHHLSSFYAAESPNRFLASFNTTFGEKIYNRDVASQY
jgi:hypothetical protein